MTSSSMPSSTPAGRRPVLIAAAACAVAVVAAVFVLSRPAADAATGPVAAAAPAPVVQQLELLHAEPFRVGVAYQHRWRADQPFVTSGWLLVLAGDPALMVPRQVREPVLQVGAMTAERINTGQPSGRLVVLVPGDFRLQDAPIFFGSPALPEELRQDQLDAELATGRLAGALPPTAAAIAKALQPARTFADDYALRQRAIDLVELHSPAEQDLIAGWRAPLVK